MQCSGVDLCSGKDSESGGLVNLCGIWSESGRKCFGVRVLEFRKSLMWIRTMNDGRCPAPPSREALPESGRRVNLGSVYKLTYVVVMNLKVAATSTYTASGRSQDGIV